MAEPVNLIRRIRRIAILVAGITVLIIGFILIFLPGPGLLVILVGLGILGTEFAFIRYVLNRLKQEMSEQKRRLRNRSPGRD